MPAERCPLSQGLAQSEGPWRERRSTSQATMVAEPLPTRLPAGYRAHRGLAPRVGSPERRQLARRHARLVKCRSACPGKTRRDFAGFPVFDVVQTVIAAAAVLLVVGAAIALLVMTEGRCWQATGSPADPTYSVIPCGSQAVLVAGGQTFASGFDSGVLTTGGGLVEAVLLLGALTLTVVTGRTSTSTGFQPSIDPAPPV